MKIQIIIFTVIAVIICNNLNAQDNKDYLYQRSYQRLADKGLSEEEIYKCIRNQDSLSTVLLKYQDDKLISLNVNDSILRRTTNSASCNDIPASEKAVLQNIFNQLNGIEAAGTWARNWDFSQPVTSWDYPTLTGWEGITVVNCHVTKISISSQYLVGTMPDLTPLTELQQLTLIPWEGTLMVSTSYRLYANSNFVSIGNLPKLKILQLYNADFGIHFTSNFNNLSNTLNYLEMINCNLNDVSELTSVVSNFTKLTTLRISYNFNNNNVVDFALPNSLTNLTNLETLIIGNSKINDINIIASPLLIKLRYLVFQSNNLTYFPPDLSNQVNLKFISLDDNDLTGSVPNYFGNLNLSGLWLNYNNLSGPLPTLHFQSPNKQFLMYYNYFRFKDFVIDFSTYYNDASLTYKYSPQAKTDAEETINASENQQVILRMCVDGNHLLDDSYQWYRNNISIPGANSREYTVVATEATTGIYHCTSKHYNPPMTNSSSYYNNLTLERNKITLSIVAPPPPCVDCTSFDLLLGEKYIISGWVKEAQSSGMTQNNVFNYQNSAIAVSFTDVNGNLINSTQNFVPTGEIIDGWQQIRGEFIVPTNVDDMKIELVNNNTQLNSFFDDIRVHPFNGNLKSFVYDQATQKLMAELDENNYATFYEYDKEGGLVRVKKETERGVYTIQETRSSTTKKTN